MSHLILQNEDRASIADHSTNYIDNIVLLITAAATAMNESAGTGDMASPLGATTGD